MALRQPITHSKKSAAIEKRPRRIAIALGLALVAATFVAHCPAIWADYAWDDDTQLRNNPLILSPGNLHKAWFSTASPDYWPLTTTMFWVEWRIWGDNPAPYRVTNILLHGLSCVVLWRILKRLDINGVGAFLGGLLFAVHPVTVESVAWIAERKNVLSMALYLITILAFLQFSERRLKKWYALTLLGAVAAMLSKTSVIMLPVVLLLLGWWRRGCITRRDLLRTMPFFLLSLVLGIVMIWFQQHNTAVVALIKSDDPISLIALVGWVVWFYLYKIILPVNLAAIYPRWHIDSGRALSYVPLISLLGCFLVFWHYRKSWGRGPLAALGSFVIVLAPVLGLLHMSYSRFSSVADHLQYPGMPGLMALMGGGIGMAWSWMRQRNKPRSVAWVAAPAGAILLTLVVLTWRQAGVYRDAVSLWTQTIQVNDRCDIAYYNRGVAYGGRRDYDSAIRDFSKAIELNPDYFDAYYNRGLAYDERGNPDKAVQDYDWAIEIKPDYPLAYNNRGNSYYKLRNLDRALRDYTKAIEFKPDLMLAYRNRAVSYYELKQYDQAWADVRMCRQLGGMISPILLQKLIEASGRAE